MKNPKTKRFAILSGIIATIAAIMTINQFDHALYLPAIFKERNNNFPIMGTESERRFEAVSDIYPGGIMRMSTHWNPQDWTPGIDEIIIKTKGFPDKLILTIKGTDCNQPAPDDWQNFVDFSLLILEKLRNAGIDVYALELWNEPDSRATVESDRGDFFGCWGNSKTSGKDYADFFNFVYSQIKATDSSLIILAGAISNIDSDFVSGMLENLATTDGVSFHCHARSQFAGCDYAISRMAAKTDRPLWITETSVICNDECNPQDGEFCKVIPCDDHEQKQVEHFDKLINDNRIKVAIWYCLCCNGWMNSDMSESVYAEFVEWLNQ